ncbi:peptidoglycan-binding protein [Mycobacterium yunnanensis]|nr:peptidoglycan-binding protein [Mycobacterium yunnanensis]
MTQRVLPYDRGIVGQERGYDCGPAAAQNVLSSRMHVSETDLIRAIGTTTDGTGNVGMIEKDLDRRVPDAKYSTVMIPNDPPTADQVETFWRNTRSSIDAGWGVVCNWVSPPSNPPRAIMGSKSPSGYGSRTIYHYVAAMGYDDNYDGRGGRALWIADSGFAPYGYWITMEQCAGLIANTDRWKGYAYAAVAPAAAPPPVAPTQAPPVIPPTPRVSLADPTTQTLIIPNSYRPRGLPSPMWIGIHTSESRSRALDLVKYCDAHEVAYNKVGDGQDIVTAVADSDAPWAAVGANKYAYHFCFSNSFAGWSRDQWLDPTDDGYLNEDAALTNGARVVAYWISKSIAAGRPIPNVWIGDGPRPPWGLNGICGHVDFGAWGGGHTDPGVNFPKNVFIARIAALLTNTTPVVIAPPPPVGVPGTSPDRYADWMLYQGNPRNDPDRVRAVQRRLRDAYASYGGHLAPDGVYGPLTKAAVAEFQRRSGLVSDGIVGPMTAAALKP